MRVLEKSGLELFQRELPIIHFCLIMIMTMPVNLEGDIQMSNTQDNLYA